MFVLLWLLLIFLDWKLFLVLMKDFCDLRK
jgi:hypothetical protein